MVNPKFWRNKRVFITGHTGFKGSWLTLWLKHMGAEVTGFSLPPPTSPSLFNLAKIARGINSVEGDIRDYSSLKNAMQNSNPQVAFHLAAQPLVRYSYHSPSETYDVNVMGSVYFLEALRELNFAQSAVLITTDKCYENKEWSWGYRETDELGGFDPYSSSKACSEIAVSSYRRSFFNGNIQTKVATARAGNVIGGGDFSVDRLIPDIFRAFQSKSDIEIRNPNATRPWQHVLEPISGYLMLAEALCEVTPKRRYDEAWNFGPLDAGAKSVRYLADHFLKLWPNASTAIKFGEEPHLHEAGVLKLDISKANQYLNWQPKLDLNKCLKITADWYRAYADGKDMEDFTLSQLIEFLKLERS